MQKQLGEWSVFQMSAMTVDQKTFAENLSTAATASGVFPECVVCWQESGDQVRCSGTQLEKVFQAPTITLTSLASRIDAHLTKPEPYHLEHVIR